MLHTQAVSTELLGLIENLMKIEAFKNFNLVGGTSLALQIGHRISIDIDLFGNSEINELEFNKELARLGKIQVLKKSKSIIIYSINGIKTDFVNYQYPLLENTKTIDSIRLLSLKDIAAMKLNAIAGRGSRKDFIDLYFLLQHYSLEELLSFYNEKYNDGSAFLVLKSLNYFEDAEIEEFPKMIQPINWNEVKDKIISESRKII